MVQPKEIKCGSIQHQTDTEAVKSDLAKMQVKGDSDTKLSSCWHMAANLNWSQHEGKRKC